MNTTMRKSSKILLAGVVAAGLSVPALSAAGAAESNGMPEVDTVAPRRCIASSTISSVTVMSPRPLSSNWVSDASLCQMMGMATAYTDLPLAPIPVVSSLPKYSLSDG